MNDKNMSNPNKRCIETVADKHATWMAKPSNPNKRCIETHFLDLNPFRQFRRTQTSVVLKPKSWMFYLSFYCCRTQTSVVLKQKIKSSLYCGNVTSNPNKRCIETLCLIMMFKKIDRSNPNKRCIET